MFPQQLVLADLGPLALVVVGAILGAALGAVAIWLYSKNQARSAVRADS